MPFTVEEGGRLNAFAKEPDMYVAEPPTNTQKRNYVVLGTISTALIGGVIWVATLVSGAS